MTALQVLGTFAAIVVLAWLAHFISYRVIKVRTLKERKWDYNICCGTTDGGGINADILRHAEVPRFELVRDVTHVPHADGAFDWVLCSHTIEHVPDPVGMFTELRRVGRHVTLLVPPLWDFTAALNPLEHQTIFLTLRSRHDNRLPRFVRFGFARWLQGRVGQRIEVDPHARQGLSPVQTLGDYAVPAVFAAASAAGFAGLAMGWALAGAGVLALWLSKKDWSAPRHR